MFWRVIVVMAVLAMGLYGAFCAYLYLDQRQLVYRPEASWLVRQPPDFLLRRGAVTLRGWVVHPGWPKALLYFGGNGERVEDFRADAASWFPDRAVYLVPYRGYGASEGEPGEQALVADAVALYDEVAPHHTQVAVIGRSLGSGVAIQLAARRPVSRLALVTPFDSMLRVARSHYPWVPVAWLLKDRYESWRYAGRLHCPVLVIRGGSDQLVPPERTRRLVAAFASPPQQLVIDEAGHNTIQDYPEYARALGMFLR